MPGSGRPKQFGHSGVRYYLMALHGNPLKAKEYLKARRWIFWLIYLICLLLLQESIFRICFPLPALKDFNRSQFVPRPPDVPSISPMRYERRTFESAPDTNHAFVHRLNGYGFRDRDWKVRKRPGKQRIMFVGDSFVEGAMVDEGQSIPDVFGTLDEAGAEIMNLGITGAGLPEYTRLIHRAVPLFQPDWLILVLFANDISNRHVARPTASTEATYYARWKPRLVEILEALAQGEPLTFRWHSPRPFMPAVPDPFNLWTKQEQDFAPHVLPELADYMRAGRFNTFRINYLAAEEKHLREKVDLLPWAHWLRDHLASYDTRVAICYLPSRSQITRRYYPFERQTCLQLCPDSLDLTQATYQQHAQSLANVCADMTWPFLDLTPVVKSYEERGQRLYWNYDDHMRKKGYQIVGEALYRWYKEEIIF